MEGGKADAPESAGDHQTKMMQLSRRITESGSAFAYVLIIQAVAVLTFLLIYAWRRKKTPLIGTDGYFFVYYLVLNLFLGTLCGCAVRARFIAPAPPIMYWAMLVGAVGIYFSIMVETICIVQDSPATRTAYNDPERFKRRVIMYAATGAILSLVVLMMLS